MNSQGALKVKDPVYEHDSQYDEVVAILFPELDSGAPSV